MDKPYYSLNRYYQNRFGCKIAKITIDGGFSCPNRQSRQEGGCRFCSNKGSGDFTTGQDVPIPLQIQEGKAKLSGKWPNAKYVAYFQAYTNTFAPVDILREKYEEAMNQPDIVGISIATRPDCLPPDVLDLLFEISKKFPLWVELGLQSAHNNTLSAMDIGYSNEDFKSAVSKLHEKGIETIAHIILGLPNESPKDMEATINFINSLPVSGIKLQLLHVLQNTVLAKDFLDKKFQILSREDYIDIVVNSIALLRPDIVIHRLTGDGGREDLIAPLWSLEKGRTLNKIHQVLKERNIIQGQDYYKKTEITNFNND